MKGDIGDEEDEHHGRVSEAYSELEVDTHACNDSNAQIGAVLSLANTQKAVFDLSLTGPSTIRST